MLDMPTTSVVAWPSGECATCVQREFSVAQLLDGFGLVQAEVQ